MALSASLEHLSTTSNNDKAIILAETLDQATGKFLEEAKSPSRVVNEIDNRGSHFYLTLYWAQALAGQNKVAELQARFAKLAQELADNEAKINDELMAAQGRPVDLGGYYKTNPELTTKAMRPSPTFNEIIASVNA